MTSQFFQLFHQLHLKNINLIYIHQSKHFFQLTYSFRLNNYNFLYQIKYNHIQIHSNDLIVLYFYKFLTNLNHYHIHELLIFFTNCWHISFHDLNHTKHQFNFVCYLFRENLLKKMIFQILKIYHLFFFQLSIIQIFICCFIFIIFNFV